VLQEALCTDSHIIEKGDAVTHKIDTVIFPLLQNEKNTHKSGNMLTNLDHTYFRKIFFIEEYYLLGYNTM
jgi:hypothetical protein